MKEKVIFDTNFLFNKVASSFFGNREELKLFSNDAEIIIPEIVLEELEAKYIRMFDDEKGKFTKTLLSHIVEHNTNEIIIENRIKELIDNEKIPYSVIGLSNYEVLPEIKKLAIKKYPPFENGEGTDKGFKDAYIYFTVLEFVQNISDKYIFICSKDKRFKNAFEIHPNIISIESYRDFKQHSISQFFDDYFIEQINEKLEFNISKENIKEYWYNINDNKVVLIEFEGEEYVIETDSGEIISSCNKSEYSALIDELVVAGSFNQTDELVEKLVSFTAFFSNEEILKILNASWRNNQISWIIYKPQIKELIGPLYSSKKELIESEEGLEFLKKVFK
jgi:rRNA-processing protein FCF1